MTRDHTIHEEMLLRVADALEEKPPSLFDNGALRADLLANSLAGVNGREASEFSYALTDLRDHGLISDLGRIRLTVDGASQVAELRRGPISKAAHAALVDSRSALIGALVAAPISVVVTIIATRLT